MKYIWKCRQQNVGYFVSASICVADSPLWCEKYSVLNCFSSRLAFVFAQSNEARCEVQNEDAVGGAPTGDAPTTSEWSASLLHAKLRHILEVWR